jgi:hypothetical protein
MRTAASSLTREILGVVIVIVAMAFVLSLEFAR